MNFLESIRKSISPIHPEGYPFIALLAVATFVFGWFIAAFFWLGLILTLWCAYFFRDPKRVTPLQKGLIVAPADGLISHIGLAIPPAELELTSEPMMRISIFMNIFDVHVNRAPMPGKVRKQVYKPGKFFNATLDKASEENERNSLILETEHGSVVVTQVAGLLARRIICWAEEGEELPVGERFGMIRFGSRVDLYLPDDLTPQVALGQRMIAGETILVDLENAPGEDRAYREN